MPAESYIFVYFTIFMLLLFPLFYIYNYFCNLSVVIKNLARSTNTNYILAETTLLQIATLSNCSR